MLSINPPKSNSRCIFHEIISNSIHSTHAINPSQEINPICSQRQQSIGRQQSISSISILIPWIQSNNNKCCHVLKKFRFELSVLLLKQEKKKLTVFCNTFLCAFVFSTVLTILSFPNQPVSRIRLRVICDYPTQSHKASAPIRVHLLYSIRLRRIHVIVHLYIGGCRQKQIVVWKRYGSLYRVIATPISGRFVVIPVAL